MTQELRMGSLRTKQTNRECVEESYLKCTFRRSIILLEIHASVRGLASCAVDKNKYLRYVLKPSVY